MVLSEVKILTVVIWLSMMTFCKVTTDQYLKHDMGNLS